MKPTAPIEGDNIPLDAPEDDMMDAPPGGAGQAPAPEPTGEEDAMGAEPPPMDAPMGAEGGAGGAEGAGMDDAGMDGAGLDSPEGDGAMASQGTGAITGKYNSSPVGDVKMTKSKGTYNTYKLELSMGQLEVILNALEKNHDDAVADELLATFQYYIDKLPGPGEEEEEAEARNNPQAAAAKAGGAMPGEETPIPMPPGKAGAGGPKDLANMPEPAAPGGAAMPPGKARMLRNAPGGPGGKPGLPGPDTEAAGPAPAGGGTDELPPPPAE